MIRNTLGFSMAVLLIPLSVMASQDCQILNTEKKLPALTSQVLVVRAIGKIQASITACQRKGSQWRAISKVPFQGVIGKQGTVLAQDKKEGDLKTPRGFFPIGTAFGTKPLSLHVDYKYITAEDKFIDDVTSKDYNTWVFGPTRAKSYEDMLVPVYEVGAVINYNMHPIIPGAGSAIFLHVWRGAHSPTAGCVAMDKIDVLRVLHWLDKRQHPYLFVTGT